MGAKKIDTEGKVRVHLGADQEGEMECLLMAISIREDQCLTYNYPVYEGDSIILQVEGSDGYSGQLELTDKGWREWERAEWSQEIMSPAQARKNLEEVL